MPSSPAQMLASSSSDLFGKDDSEFLDALADVDIPQEAVKDLPAIKKEQSLSSDLFGTEDQAFLDALSKTTFPDDMSEQPSQLRLDPSDQTFAIPQTLRSQALKRPHSPDQDISSLTFDPTGLSFSSTDPNNGSTYTDSDIYGASKFHGFGEYMYRKRAKLHIQNAEMEESSGGKKSALFQGLALHVNGKTNPSVQELRKLIIRHGGIFHPYLDRKKMVTHVIASNLTPSKVLEFKNMKVVTPAWLLESIEAGTLLPWRHYAIGVDHRPDDSQGRVTTTSGSTSVECLKFSQIEKAQDVTESTHEQDITMPMSGLSPSNIVSSSPDLDITDPRTSEQAAQMPSYAPSGSNPHAKRKMADPEWRAANTAVAPGFIEGYFKNSRLHHLSTWKAELQDLVAKAAERVEIGDMPQEIVEESRPDGAEIHGVKFQRPMSPMKRKENNAGEKVIMHCDFDSFFVSAGIIDRPHLKGKPVVVCHSQGEQVGSASTSEIASSSYEARKFGIKNGMSLGQAKKLCPNIHTIPYEFERYKRLSLQFYTILMSYADDLQAVSVDEALVDVTSTIETARRTAYTNGAPHPVQDLTKSLAETIRAKIRQATGCEVSIGISHNILLARIATRRAKPAGSYHIQPEEVSEILAPLDIKDLRGFGYSTRNKVEAKFGVTTLGELANRPKGALCEALGKKTGETLWKAVRGIDETKIESDRIRKSVSSEINYGIRFNDNKDAEGFIRNMAIEVAKRLTSIGMCGRSLTLKIMTRDPKAPVEAPKFLGHGICNTTNKTSPLETPGGHATADESIIGECALRVLKGMHLDPKELRGIGIHVQKLERLSDSRTAQGILTSGGQSVLQFKQIDDHNKDVHASPGKEPGYPIIIVDPRSPDNIAEDLRSSSHEAQYLGSDATKRGLVSISQVDPSFLVALPADIRDELEREYGRTGSGQAVAGPSRYKSPESHAASVYNPPSEHDKHTTSTQAPLARITGQFTLKSRPSMSPSKRMHPLFTKRKAPVTLKVSAAELKLLDIDADVWAELPVELQREQIAAFRAANVGTGMAVRASMSTQAKQERILSRWRAMRRGSPFVGIKGKRPKITAKALELPRLKQRGNSKSAELRVSETNDIQAVIGKWVRGFEDDGPRLGDVEYFGKFLERCVETDVGAEKAVSALKWWRILLRQRWADMEKLHGNAEIYLDTEAGNAGRDWWHAFWDVKTQMDRIIGKRFGGRLSLK